MPCFSPLTGYKSAQLTKNGKRKLVFTGGFSDLPVTVACGQCIGCRLERSRQWATRCLHEAQLHATSSFVTLTYCDNSLPLGGTLIKKHFQDFMKRLRKKYGKVRYFHCGEYGETSNRPHYHALLFGLDFPDKTFHTENGQGNTIYKSDTLNTLWGHGFCTIGDVNFETAAYTARYILKKVTGEAAQAHYSTVDPATGEIITRLPEYITMSLKPAIGQGWFDQFSSDVYPDDFVVVRGKTIRPPRFYDRKYALQNPAAAEKIKYRRIRNGALHKADNTPERLAVKRQVKLSQIKSLSRTL